VSGVSIATSLTSPPIAGQYQHCPAVPGRHAEEGTHG
jgi:hypothetical protein